MRLVKGVDIGTGRVEGRSTVLGWVRRRYDEGTECTGVTPKEGC